MKGIICSTPNDMLFMIVNLTRPGMTVIKGTGLETTHWNFVDNCHKICCWRLVVCGSNILVDNQERLSTRSSKIPQKMWHVIPYFVTRGQLRACYSSPISKDRATARMYCIHRISIIFPTVGAKLSSWDFKTRLVFNN